MSHLKTQILKYLKQHRKCTNLRLAKDPDEELSPSELIDLYLNLAETMMLKISQHLITER